MSRPELPRIGVKPFIALVDRANRALQNDMVETMRRSGHPEAKHAYNGVFATLQREGSRSADMAVRAGMTRQSMGEVIRELVALGILEMAPDPEDKRAKIVTYTDRGLEVAASGYDHLRDLEERFAAEFGPAEYSTARQVLARVADVLEEWASEADRASE